VLVCPLLRRARIRTVLRFVGVGHEKISLSHRAQCAMSRPARIASRLFIAEVSSQARAVQATRFVSLYGRNFINLVLMRFPKPLIRGRLIRRYKRFLADVELEGGNIVTANCPNTGSMLGLSAPGTSIWLSTNDAATRKYRHTLELAEHDLWLGQVLVRNNPAHTKKIGDA